MKNNPNKQIITEQILDIISQCERLLKLKTDKIVALRKIITDNSVEVGNSHCGSWLGYQSRIYYKDFKLPPAGAHFSIEWGFTQAFSNDTRGDWQEYNYDTVKRVIFRDIKEKEEKELEEACERAIIIAEEIKALFTTLIDVILESNSNAFFNQLKIDLAKNEIRISQATIEKVIHPRSEYMTRDQMALSQGVLVPPHIHIQSWLMAITNVFSAAEELLALAKKVYTYMKINNMLERKEGMEKGKVFIGHGHSAIWRELKDFIHDRLGLEWEEFNRSSAAGLTKTEHLQDMLNASIFAFLVMTGEDEHADKSIHARENVIHEVGLFQGKLGFRKAIVLLEDGCAEFSNITGLIEIRFPKGNIGAKFEEIRQVLEREGLIDKK